MKKLFIIACITTIITGCSTVTQQTNNRENQTTHPPIKTSTDTQIIDLKNNDSYNLTAQYINKEIDGKTYKMLSYNGSIPGPTLKVQQGSEITVNFKNDTDIPTSLHSHGVRLSSEFDGIVDVQQKPINPGETFTYKIKFPDAGIYWYHPHLNEPYTQSRGLYGNYWVVPTDNNFWSPVNQEIPIILSDLNITKNGLKEYDPKTVSHALMGEFGNTMLVNGKTDYQINAKKGDVIRMFVTNASNTRVYNLQIPNTKIKLVGSDNGKYQSETYQNNIILSPSERTIIEVMFEKPGTYTLENANPFKTYTLATINISPEKTETDFSKEFNTLRVNDALDKEIQNLLPQIQKPLDKSIHFTLDSQMGMMRNNGHMGNQMMGNDSPIEWEDTMAMMNAMTTTDTVKWKIIDDETQKENMDIHWKFKKGDFIKIKVSNDEKSMHPMQHPFHFHGQKFLVLSTNGTPNQNMAWKDTALIQNGDVVELLIPMDNPGKWMAHCHISEHLASGMMLMFDVLEQ